MIHSDFSCAVTGAFCAVPEKARAVSGPTMIQCTAVNAVSITR